MKKYTLIFLSLIITLSFYGCTTKNNMIGTKNDVAYFNKPKSTPKIVYTNEIETQEKEIKIEDDSFFDKLITAVDGKPAGNDFCKCVGDYQVVIDNKYTFRLHPDKIVFLSDTKEFTDFTVKCSEEEMKELYDIINTVN